MRGEGMPQGVGTGKSWQTRATTMFFDQQVHTACAQSNPPMIEKKRLVHGVLVGLRPDLEIVLDGFAGGIAEKDLPFAFALATHP
jgi:hypothetical protein